MRSIAAGFRGWLQALGPVTTAGAKVHLSRVPQTEECPCITVNRSGGDPLQVLDTDDDSLQIENFELRTWAFTGKEADELMDALVEELEDFEGNMGSARRCEAVLFDGLPSLDVGDIDFGDQKLRHFAELPVTLQHSPQA